MPLDVLLVLILRTLVEVAGFALLGQGVLALLAGKYREDNIFYRTLRIVASPAVRAVRFITPRFILDAHVQEMTDLPATDQQRLLRVVLAAESALREVMAPDKINLASLGNVVPHLHWHVIPRFTDDPHFPNPVWDAKQRDAPHAAPPDLDARLAATLHNTLQKG